MSRTDGLTQPGLECPARQRQAPLGGKRLRRGNQAREATESPEPSARAGVREQRVTEPVNGVGAWRDAHHHAGVTSPPSRGASEATASDSPTGAFGTIRAFAPGVRLGTITVGSSSGNSSR